MPNNITSASNMKTKTIAKNEQNKGRAQKRKSPDISTPNTTISLSSKAKKLNATEKSMLSEASFNDVKVAEIKLSIAKGEYKINTIDIAKKIFNDLG